MALTQENRAIAIETPLGKDVLLLQGFKGREGISELFTYEAELLSLESSIRFEDIVGKAATIGIELPGGGQRYVSGFVSRFVQGDRDHRFTHYRAEIVPWLWFLTRTSDCRIFQKKSVPEIVKQIFSDLGFTDFRDALQGSFERRDYCVQYRETDFHFVSRLMEEEGIFYFFEHDNTKHTLVLGNKPAAHKACPDQAKARCAFGTGGVEDEDVVTACHLEQEFRPGKVSLTDYNFETPSTSLHASASTMLQVAGASSYEVFDYPGLYGKKAQGARVAELRMEEEEATHLVLEGESTCRAFVAGAKFQLTGHYREDLNQEYVLLSVDHEASAGAAYVTGPAEEGREFYSNHFRSIPHSTPYRPARLTRRPVVEGPQTAVVVGKSGEEIWTDKYGRVKVRFHWDREGKADENSSCWIRVSQGWAGKKWGMMFLPRIGQEVIVDFLEGDPDRPIITGRVPNAEEMPPYELPGEQTKSTLKSLSSKGGGGFNEIRFEDKKGSEQLFLHAEKNQDNRVKSKSLEWVGKSRHLIVGGDQLEKVGGDKHLTVTGDQNEKVDGTLSVEAGMDRQRKVGKNYALDSGMEIHLKSGMNVVMESGTTLTLKVGGNFININSGGIFIQGTMVMLNSGGSAGSGGGSSPEAPKKPREADKAKAGELDKPPSPVVVTRPPVSPQAVALRRAAQQGAPFCEVCAAAARAAALAAGATPEEAEREAREAGLAGAEESPEDEWQSPTEEKVHWVEIELRDQDGNPVPNERYEVELPDGSKVEGRLDSSGQARVDGIENPGVCKVTFPGLYNDAGEPV